MESIYDIARNIGHIGSFTVKKTVFHKGNGLVTEDAVFINPQNADHNSIAVKTTAVGTIIISAKKGPGREFAKALLQKCQRTLDIDERKITLLNDDSDKPCHH
jgi:hypothetical protein